MKIKEYTGFDPLINTVCKKIAVIIENRLLSQERVTIALSGGKTPKKYLTQLFNSPIDWGKVNITLSDERWVSPEHPDSNEKLVQSCIKHTPAEAARFIGLWADYELPSQAKEIISSRLSSIQLPVDIALLGIGEDGHIASIFPSAQEPIPNDPICIAVDKAPLYPRLSLSPDQIKSIRDIHVIIRGNAKKSVLENEIQLGQASKLPISLLINHQSNQKVVFHYSD